MHVGRGESHVAQLFGLETADVLALLGDQKSPELRHIGLNRQLVERLGIVVLTQYAERLGCQCLEILLARRHADVVETIVGAERIRRVDHVAADATRFAVEQRQAALRGGRQCRAVAGRKAIER